ncbi:MAG: hypothetical protein U0289_00845 [Cyclobacteriaceae bacterium]|jgi:hypothetical protein|nr:hypothetical protein [Cytophagales bacterium]HNP75594.1 hypothetical protein [Cyclobacteriaceae bacterium]
MLEHRSKPLLPFHLFLLRWLRYLIFSLLLIGCSLGIGMAGYHYLNDLPWLDSLLNASMILTGMGPVDALKNDASKWFASFYAIFSGVAFLSTVAVFLTPVVHRFLHKHHLDQDKP